MVLFFADVEDRSKEWTKASQWSSGFYIGIKHPRLKGVTRLGGGKWDASRIKISGYNFGPKVDPSSSKI